MASSKEPGGARPPETSPPEWLMDAALARIHAGSLPKEPLSKVLAGPGRGQVCALCLHAIELGDVGYEVVADEAGEPGRSLHFHVSCYRAWTKACGGLPRSFGQSASSPMPPLPPSKRSGP